jgi:glycosyltransferase involved in cell wall biosynthesis
VKFGIPKENVSILGEGINPPRLRGFPKEKEPTLIYVGRLKKYKRVEMLIEASTILKNEFPGLKVWIVGSGDMEPELKKNSKEWIHFFGFVDEKKKWELLERAWIFVMPSVKEGFGLTVAEAEACGLPAVGFNVPGIRDSI